MNAAERAVLVVLLEHHPGQLSTEELVRALAPEPHADVLVAAGDLLAAGLAHRHGEFWFASVAAVHFDRLGV